MRLLTMCPFLLIVAQLTLAPVAARNR